MTLVRWKPFRDFLGMHENVNRLFENEYFGEQGNDVLASWSPVTDIYEEADKYLLRMEVPGLSESDIDIEFSGDTFTVKGEKKDSSEVKRENYHRVESFSGKFSRSFLIPKSVEADKIAAEMKNGVLNISVPKAEKKKAKSIPISTK